MHKLALVLASLIVLGTAAVAAEPPSEYATKDDARALLDKAVAAVKADKAKALQLFNEAGGAFRDRDLYVFCANAADGIETAHPTAKGEQLRDIKDVNGFAFGATILDTATAGTVSEIDYYWPRPGSDAPAAKSTFYTKVDDQVCAVGYYK